MWCSHKTMSSCLEIKLTGPSINCRLFAKTGVLFHSIIHELAAFPNSLFPLSSSVQEYRAQTHDRRNCRSCLILTLPSWKSKGYSGIIGGNDLGGIPCCFLDLLFPK